MRGPHYNNKCPRATTRTQRRYSVRAARVAGPGSFHARPHFCWTSQFITSHYSHLIELYYYVTIVAQYFTFQQ